MDAAAVYCDVTLKRAGFNGEYVQSGSVIVVKTHRPVPSWTESNRSICAQLQGVCVCACVCVCVCVCVYVRVGWHAKKYTNKGGYKSKYTKPSGYIFTLL